MLSDRAEGSYEQADDENPFDSGEVDVFVDDDSESEVYSNFDNASGVSDDYPDSDDELIVDFEKEARRTEEPDTSSKRDSQRKANIQGAVSLEDSVKSSYFNSEVRRVLHVLKRHGIDFQEELLGLYSFHIVNKMVNNVEYPDSFSDIISDIVDDIGVERLGY